MHFKSPGTNAAATARASATTAEDTTSPLDFCLVEVSTAVSDAELKLLNFGPAFEANASGDTDRHGETPVLAVSRQDGTPGLAPTGSGFVHDRMPERWVLEHLRPICRPIVLTEVGAAGSTAAAAAPASSSAREGTACWRLLGQVGSVCRLRRRFLTQRPLPMEAATVLSQQGGMLKTAVEDAVEVVESENHSSSAAKRKKKKKRSSSDRERQASPEPVPEPIAVPSDDQRQQSSHTEDQKKSKKRKKHKRERHSESSA